MSKGTRQDTREAGATSANLERFQSILEAPRNMRRLSHLLIFKTLRRDILAIFSWRRLT